MVETTTSGNSLCKCIYMPFYKLLLPFSPKLNLILYKMMVFVVQEDYHNPPRGCVSYPGSEIPEWFSYQSMGSSVTLELPPGWVNNNFVGFALCAIVPDHHGDTRGFTVRCILKTKDDVAVCSLYVWNHLGVNPSIESDHVLLGYDFSLSSDSLGGSNNEFCIQFNIQHYEGPGIEGFDVKKCGAHLIYVQDPSKRLRSEVEDYQVLHPKRLKYP